ncbi:UDP-N-acetylmuramoyl-tripeptide--D-alanyl-D-alanine ligase [Salinimicrobium oceani]|uniref:UDP-N-acetylmuramoyl-tripeptide--D-alanyl-D-alanine ligase n=1 Tax=Salinimicrobium oceani TaxID=2722702 RepID=A0ABX1D583_9FLAO|nr:UDP-N-acetylmuramoyl-tripeptide--D-alanyl-D-alanine ligase [Salinimicrobium oceani]NJW53903.1 UDP-N-acetylmuramoyl-tripeptide--D-alanyl-D-alanine ligase [Salinimicrobium oceani]
MDISHLHNLFLASSGISTDTRKIKENSIFFALKGEKFNANDFAEDALQKGAAFAVVDETRRNKNEKFIKVEDALKALQQLAAYHRRYLDIPILALTGSNGKTTTKELINAVLSKKFRTVATSGNLNNHIGVPLTLLSMTRDTEMGIVEMGANHQQEISFLCGIAEPDYGYITNFGKAHLEGFGSVEGVIKGKKELYTHLKEREKLLFLNLNDPLQKMEENYMHTFTFGTNCGADVELELCSRDSFAGIKVNGKEITGNLTGAYNSINMAAAYTIATRFKVPEDQISKALEEYLPRNNRSQIILKDNRKIIMDAYNANPSSMAAALENLNNMDLAPKIAILGDMFELGLVAREEHEQVIKNIEESTISKAFVIGANFSTTATSSEKVKKFATFEEFQKWFQPSEFNAGIILIKGSRGMALERVLELI